MMQVAFYKAVRPGLQGLYSRAVQLVDRGPYSHCELIFSDGMSGSASYIDGGVRLKWIDYNSSHWDFLELPDWLEPKARAWFEAHEGDGYDLLGNLRFVFWLVREGKSGWFCNEAVATALGFKEAWRLGPNGFYATLASLQNNKQREVPQCRIKTIMV